MSKQFSLIFAATSFAEGLAEALTKNELLTESGESAEVDQTLEVLTETEQLKKYGSAKWTKLVADRLAQLTPGQAEGFEIVGKSARKAKGSIGLKGKRGLKTFFVHGISK